MERLKRRKELAQQSRADVIIGKAGLSEGVISEIERQLEEKEIVKVKALKSALKVEGLDRRELARKTAELVGAMLLEVRGRTFILYKPKRKALKRGSINHGKAHQ